VQRYDEAVSAPSGPCSRSCEGSSEERPEMTARVAANRAQSACRAPPVLLHGHPNVAGRAADPLSRLRGARRQQSGDSVLRLSRQTGNRPEGWSRARGDAGTVAGVSLLGATTGFGESAFCQLAVDRPQLRPQHSMCCWICARITAPRRRALSSAPQLSTRCRSGASRLQRCVSASGS